MIKYKLREDHLKTDDGVRHIGYGVDAYKRKKIVRTVKDITLNRKYLMKKIALWNKTNLNLIYLDYAIEDLLNEEENEKPYSFI